MAFYNTPQGKAGLAIAAAVLFGYVAYSGDGIGSLGIPGLSARTETVQRTRDSIAMFTSQVDSAKRELARGSIEDVKRRVAEYERALTALKEFVPGGSEVADLLDNISTRAKLRGVNLSQFAPKPVEPGPAPYDTYTYDMSVIGRYDQVGRFLTDIASLKRIMVPIDLTLKRAQAQAARALGDTSPAMLEAKFQIRTYVKSTTAGIGGASGS